MDKQSRRDAMQAYREREKAPGIFAIRCAATGEAWVGASPDLSVGQNGPWFALKLGSHPNKVLQAAWNTHGADSFTFEELERLDVEALTPVGRADLMKARERHWMAALGASRVAG